MNMSRRSLVSALLGGAVIGISSPVFAIKSLPSGDVPQIATACSTNWHDRLYNFMRGKIIGNSALDVEFSCPWCRCALGGASDRSEKR